MVNITSSMLELLEDENKSDKGFQIVAHHNRKYISCNDKNKLAFCEQNACDSASTSRAVITDLPRTTDSGCHWVGKPDASSATSQPPSYSDVTAATDGAVLCYPGASVMGVTLVKRPYTQESRQQDPVTL